MIDVGQGDSTFINLPHNQGNILIDTGGKMDYVKESWEERKHKYIIGEDTIIPYLKSIGIKSLDSLILTHGDNDHSGDALYLVENFKVDNVILNIGEYNDLELELIKVLKEKNIPYYQNIETLNIGDDKLYFLNTKDYNDENENSSVIYTEIDNTKMLFMGDAGTEREKDILEKYNFTDIDILKVNGKDLKDEKTIYRLLMNTVGKDVELTVNSKADLAGSRTIIVNPIADESQLYYYNQIQENIRKVNEATNGEVGYIHIPDMGPEGLTEFVKYYYPQLCKRALIIDDRGNGGGNVSPMIIERLRRELMLMAVSRNAGSYSKPDGMMNGPKVLLLNEYSASDGDLFPYQFREAKLGKLIGRRSWGGVVGIRGSLPFIDGSTLTRPEFAHYDKNGKEFIIEGHGVDPDIVVYNDPAKEFAGEDEQLNKAIEVILDELKNWPKEQYPAVPQYPLKNK